MTPIKTPKKLIEVALPLDDINEACAHEKMPGIGAHPRGLHLYWARRPLAAARAVIFAQMVNDPGYERHLGRGVNKKEAELKREKLFEIIRKLVKWENTTNEEVLAEAREVIKESWRETCELNRNHPQAAELFNPEKLPAFHDPFAGGGAIPLEAQRLGLESWASDLNPVAVMINKAMIEIPPKFAGRAPVGPMPKGEQNQSRTSWDGAQGLAEDVRRYGAWMREEAVKRIGHLYPQIKITPKMAENRADLKPLIGQKLTVIAWLWARTVKSPNPVYSHIDVPLISTFIIGAKSGKEAWIEPIVIGDKYHFEVRIGKPPSKAKGGTTAGKRSAFRCLISDVPIDYDYIRTEGKAGRIGQKLLVIIAEGTRGRIYLDANEEHEQIINTVIPQWKPETILPGNTRDFKTPLYGMDTFGDLFTNRQLAALTTFSDLVMEAKKIIETDAIAAGMKDDGKNLWQGGLGAAAYADAICVYLAFAISRLADYNSQIATWKSSGEQVMQTFKRQALPMTWDFPESNILIDKAICWLNAVKYTYESVKQFSMQNISYGGYVCQSDAQTQTISINKVISTDPPYYDNIGYAELSDFFYVWMRRSLRDIFPSLFETLATPKAEELVATPYRHGNKIKAEKFFLDGMTEAMHRLSEQAHGAFPITIYYAFKQSDSDSSGTVSTGWETFLAAVLKAGLTLTGTWPMRTELSNRMIGSGTNALASSIILVCRPRSTDAPTVSRREFLATLREELPDALEAMIGGTTGFSPVAPVDLAQSAIGPGIAVFSRYSAVLKSDGEPMSVREALQVINEEIDRILEPDASNSDVDTRFCVAWFDTVGWREGAFGEADTLARAKGTSVAGLVESGVVESGVGKVRLLKANEYPSDWDPEKDHRLPVWEALHHLVRLLSTGGEEGAGAVLAKLHDKSEAIRALAYRLYTLCERKGWAEDARGYNELVTSWHAIETASHRIGRRGAQTILGLE